MTEDRSRPLNDTKMQSRKAEQITVNKRGLQKVERGINVVCFVPGPGQRKLNETACCIENRAWSQKREDSNRKNSRKIPTMCMFRQLHPRYARRLIYRRREHKRLRNQSKYDAKTRQKRIQKRQEFHETYRVSLLGDSCIVTVINNAPGMIESRQPNDKRKKEQKNNVR